MQANESKREVRVLRAQFLAEAHRVLGEQGKKVPEYVIAQVFDMHPSTLSQYLNGHRAPAVEFIGQAMDMFGCSFERVFVLKDVPVSRMREAVAA